MHRKTLGNGVRRARRGFTLIELTIAMSMLMIAMVSAASTTMRMHSLRKQNREHIVAQNALRSMAERIHAQSYRFSFLDPDTWSENVLATFGPGGTAGSAFDVDLLNPPSVGVLPGSLRIVIDETTTDAALGMELGMPRDLNGDGDALDTDVTDSACILPVTLTIEWQSQRGLEQLTHGFYTMGY
jgi:type II secretory pathway pseudopilin PulG